MLHNREGVTLIELVVVMSIMAIIMSIAIPMYSKYERRVNVERETKKVFTVLNQARLKAFTQKEDCKVEWDSNPFTLLHRMCGSDNATTTLKCEFQSRISSNVLYVKFSMGGVSKQTGSIHCEEDAKYNCVNISKTRIILGKWNGSSCEVE